MNERHEGWIVSLSNGETILETAPIPGEITPWQKVLEFLRENKDEKMTGLRLAANGLLFHALPDKHCEGYFQARESVQFYYQRIKRLMQGIGSVVGDQVYITWVSIDGNPYVYQEIRDLKSCQIHTTLYEVQDGKRVSKEDNEHDK